MVGAGPLAVLDLGLGDGGAVVDVPHRRRLGAVGLAAGQVAQERGLAGAPADVVDRRVLERPVVGQAEPAEQLLEHGLVRRPSARGRASTKLGREIGSSWCPWARRRGTAARSQGRTAARGRSARRRSSAPGARWPARCRPSRSGRTRPCRPSAGSGRWRRSGCSRTRCPCGWSRTPSAAVCRWRTRRPARPCGRSGRCPRPPSARTSAASMPSSVGRSGIAAIGPGYGRPPGATQAPPATPARSARPTWLPRPSISSSHLPGRAQSKGSRGRVVAGRCLVTTAGHVGVVPRRRQLERRDHVVSADTDADQAAPAAFARRSAAPGTQTARDAAHGSVTGAAGSVARHATAAGRRRPT